MLTANLAAPLCLAPDAGTGGGAPVAAPAAPAAPPADDATKTEAAPPAADKPPEEPKPPPRKFKAKVDGREIELDEQEVIQSGLRAAQMQRAAQQRFAEAQKAKAEADGFKKRLETDFLGTLREIAGGNEKLRAAIEEYMVGEIQREKMDPAQAERLKIEEELKAERAKREGYEKAEADRKAEAAREHFKNHYDKVFSEALAKHNLPKLPETLRRMAGLTKKAEEMGLDLGADDVASLVREEIVEESNRIFGAMDGNRLIDLLPPEVLKKIRAADVARVKAAGQPAAPAQAPAPKPKPQPTEDNPNPHLKNRDEWYRAQGLEPPF
jgi:hypothetical protein